MKKTSKVIHSKYSVTTEKLTIPHLYVSEGNSEELFFGGFYRIKDITYVRVLDGGLNLYKIPIKLKRRIQGFLAKGHSVTIRGVYKTMKIRTDSDRW